MATNLIAAHAVRVGLVLDTIHPVTHAHVTRVVSRVNIHPTTGVTIWYADALGPTRHAPSEQLTIVTAQLPPPAVPDPPVTPPTPLLPDLIVTAITMSPASPRVGDHIIFSATIKNVGLAPTPGGAIHDVLFTVDSGGPPADDTWSDTSIAPLAVGASRTVQANGGSQGINYWVGTNGLHSLVARVNTRVPGIDESDMTNNSLTVPFTVSSATWSPADESPAFWYKADVGVTSSGGAVSQWNDQTSHVLHVVQATGANKPTTGAATVNGINVIRFTGAQFLAKTGFAHAQPFTICLVGTFRSIASSYESLFDLGTQPSTPGPQATYDVPTTQIGLYAGTFAGTSWTPDTSPHSFAFVFNGATSQFYVDGVNYGPIDAGTQAAVDIRIGGTNDGALADIDVGEMFCVLSVMSDASLANFCAYANTRWATTCSAASPNAPHITHGTPSNATQGQPYSYVLQATGDTPITWSKSGTLPTGLSLNASTGEISGTPTALGTFGGLTFTATNAVGSDTTLTESITVSAAGARQPALGWLGIVDLNSLEGGTAGGITLQTLSDNGFGGNVISLGHLPDNVPSWMISEWITARGYGSLYVVVNIADPLPTTDAEWTTVLNNLTVVRDAALSAGASGMGFDAEPYGFSTPIWDDATGGSLTMRQRGAQVGAIIKTVGPTVIYPSSNASWPNSNNDEIQVQNGTFNAYTNSKFPTFVDGLVDSGVSLTITDASFHYGVQNTIPAGDIAVATQRVVTLTHNRFPTVNASIMIWPDIDEGSHAPAGSAFWAGANVQYWIDGGTANSNGPCFIYNHNLATGLFVSYWTGTALPAIKAGVGA